MFLETHALECFGNLRIESGKNGCELHNDEILHEKTRYCRECDEILCISKFRFGQRRFQCREHYSIVAAKNRSQPWRKEIVLIHAIWKNDSKSFKKAIVGITQKHEIFGITRKDISTIFKKTNDDDKKIDFAILPKNPYEVISGTNYVIVKRECRKSLLNCMKTRQYNLYTTLVSTMAVSFDI
jgi:hypothetical protein